MLGLKFCFPLFPFCFIVIPKICARKIEESELGLSLAHGAISRKDKMGSTKIINIIFILIFSSSPPGLHQGETFDVPEVVPFRLTHNMVHAMGPMGPEGLFRQACEVTLRLMRDQREPLMRYTHGTHASKRIIITIHRHTMKRTHASTH